MEKIGIESTQARWQGKGSRIGDHLAAQAEARKNAHEAGAQAVRGAQGQSGRVAATDFEFPDLIVDEIGATQAKIRGCQELDQVLADRLAEGR